MTDNDNDNDNENEKEEKKEKKSNLDLITSSISVCIEQGQSAMNEKVSEAARNYYLSIVNNNDLSIDQQRHKIYQDLVIGTKANLLNINDVTMDNNNNKLNLSYRIGLDNDIISKVNGEIICVGQYKENDIYIESPHISRIHCFIFQINDKLIILDGWSKCGTNTINIAYNDNPIDYDDIEDNDDNKDDKNDKNDNNDNQDIILNKNNFDMDDIIEIKEFEQNEDKDKMNKMNKINKINKVKIKNKLISSLPKERNILQFDINDTIHLKLGRDSYGIDIIINPKLCIVCMEKARVVRLNCGHQILCNQCYNKLNENMYSSQCPLCRKHIDIIVNKISAGVHTYTSQ